MIEQGEEKEIERDEMAAESLERGSTRERSGLYC